MLAKLRKHGGTNKGTLSLCETHLMHIRTLLRALRPSCTLPPRLNPGKVTNFRAALKNIHSEMAWFRSLLNNNDCSQSKRRRRWKVWFKTKCFNVNVFVYKSFWKRSSEHLVDLIRWLSKKLQPSLRPPFWCTSRLIFGGETAWHWENCRLNLV